MSDADDRRKMFHTESFGGDGYSPAPTIEVKVESAEQAASLFAKIAKVNAAITKLKHTGKYSAGKTEYTYATEADVLEPISAAIVEAGLASMPSVVEQHWHDLPGKYGTNRVCTVHAELLLGDTEGGGFVKLHTYSTAANADKASNAAFTTAIKYLLAKLALVAFGDDADEYTVEGQKADGSASKPTKPKKPKAATKAEREKVQGKITALDKGDDVKAWLKAAGITWSKITTDQLAELDAAILN